jgi:predicted ATPase/class 3 adenylate cyclase
VPLFYEYMNHIPTGTVTFLFTDIEGSTKLWEAYPDAMKAALAHHDEILRTAIESNDGYVFKTIGDAFCAAFRTAIEAVIAIAQAQTALQAEDWGEIGTLKVRAALHTGSTDERGRDYFGTPVNRVARLLSASHGGQTLLSHATSELVRDTLPEGANLTDLGEHRLKDLARPDKVFQLTTLGLASDFAALKTLDALPNNLPVQPTPFIGREHEVEEVKRSLSRPEVRLLTLTGPGGTGKTRLGLQVAADEVDQFEDGVFYVPLDSVTDASLVATAIGQELGLQEGGDLPIADILRSYLKNRRVLLLLDNFEQVITAATYVADLIAACPRIVVLVTSREVLHIQGEHYYPVPALSLPDREVYSAPGFVEQLTQYEAVRLFIDRAVAVQPDFEVTGANAPAVAEICHRLDGLPLAIELAVSRIRLLPPKKLLERLDKTLPLLTRGAKDRPSRQQTLRGAIAWSYDLLDEEVGNLFRRLSVFAGGFTLEAAEEVCGTVGPVECDVLDGLASLEEKSLLRRAPGTDESRFNMLETVREFAQEALKECGEDDSMRSRHAVYLLGIAEQSNSDEAKQVYLFEKLYSDRNNLRECLSWAQRTGKAELGLKLSGALGAFWWRHGLQIEGTEFLLKSLSMSSRSPNFYSARCLQWAGLFTSYQGDTEQGVSMLVQSVRACRMLGDLKGTAESLRYLGYSQRLGEKYDLARESLQESLKLFRQLDSEMGVANSSVTLGLVAQDKGELPKARRLFEAALAVRRKFGDRDGISGTLWMLGRVLHRQGDYEQAKELIEESLAMQRAIQGRNVGWVAMALGSLYMSLGATGRGSDLLEESLEFFENVGDRRGGVVANRRSAEAELNLGKEDVARKHIESGLVLAKEINDTEGAIQLLGLSALVARKSSQLERSARLYGAFEYLKKDITFRDRFHYDEELVRFIPATRTELGEETFTALWEEGQAMSLDEAVKYALREKSNPARPR